MKGLRPLILPRSLLRTAKVPSANSEAGNDNLVRNFVRRQTVRVDDDMGGFFVDDFAGVGGERDTLKLEEWFFSCAAEFPLECSRFFFIFAEQYRKSIVDIFYIAFAIYSVARNLGNFNSQPG